MKLIAIVLASLLFTAAVHAGQGSMEDQAAALSQAAIGNRMPPLSFVGVDGKSVDMGSFRGKPVVVSMVYTGCADVCPAIIENLRPAIEIAQDALGNNSFAVITIGFDTRHDTPQRMLSFARTRGIDLPNWQFLSGTEQTIRQIADTTGFSIVPSAGGFDHSAQVSLFDADGTLYQQIRGGVFPPQAIVEPLKDLMFGQRRPILSVAGITERIKLFCTVYNPNTGRYYFNYSLFIGLGIGIACLLLVLAWLVRELRLTARSGGGVHE